MRTLDRYLLREGLKALVLALTVLTSVYILADLLQNVGRFLAVGASFGDVALYYLLLIPKTLPEVTPVSVLLACVLSLGTLARHNEVLAMRMGHWSTLRIAAPLLVLAVAVCGGLWAVTEWLAPRTTALALDLSEAHLGKGSKYRRTRENDIWYRAGEETFLHIGILQAREGMLREVTVFRLTPAFVLAERVDAPLARWEGAGWVLEGATVRRFADGRLVTVQTGARYPLALTEGPEDFALIEKDPAEMGFQELRRHIRRLLASGANVRRVLADLHAKPARAVLPLLMGLIGVAAALRVGRRGLMVSLAACILVASLYLPTFQISLSLGRGEILAPWLAAWLPNAAFGTAGLVALLRTP
jgi:lipopolysaccharide export system permease protein